MTSFINSWKGSISIKCPTIDIYKSYSGKDLVRSGKMMSYILFTNILPLNPKHCILFTIIGVGKSGSGMSWRDL